MQTASGDAFGPGWSGFAPSPESRPFGDHPYRKKGSAVTAQAKLKTVEQVIEEAGEARKRNIAQRINAAMAEVDYIQKERPKEGGMKYSFVSHDAVTRKVRPILQAHGIVYYPKDLVVSQSGNRTEAVFNVRFENVDDRTDYIDVATMGYGVDGQDKGPGKAISYGVKYALLKVLGLETGDDPEEVQDETANHNPDAAIPGFISQTQRDDLVALAQEVGADVPRFCKYFGVRTLSCIPEDRYQAAVDALKAKRQKEPVNA